MEEIKLKMYQIENEVSSHPLNAEGLHQQADQLLLDALASLATYQDSNDSTHACIRDIIASFNRASHDFWYA